MAARGGGGAHRAAQPSRDVVGRAKGQGQDQVFVKIQIYSGQSIFFIVSLPCHHIVWDGEFHPCLNYISLAIKSEPCGNSYKASHSIFN